MMATDDRADRMAELMTDLEDMPDDRAEAMVRLGRGVPLDDVEKFVALARQRAAAYRARAEEAEATIEQ